MSHADTPDWIQWIEEGSLSRKSPYHIKDVSNRSRETDTGERTDAMRVISMHSSPQGQTNSLFQ